MNNQDKKDIILQELEELADELVTTQRLLNAIANRDNDEEFISLSKRASTSKKRALRCRDIMAHMELQH